MFPDFIPEQLLWALGLSVAIVTMATHAHADLSVSHATTHVVSCQQSHSSAAIPVGMTSATRQDRCPSA